MSNMVGYLEDDDKVPVSYLSCHHLVTEDAPRAAPIGTGRGAGGLRELLGIPFELEMTGERVSLLVL